jgi:hypothetical protein
MKKIFYLVLLTFLLLFLLLLSIPKEKEPKIEIEIGNSSHYMGVERIKGKILQNVTIRKETMGSLLSDFYNPATGLFYNFHREGNFSVEKHTVWGPPYEFMERGDDEISGFNAFVGFTLLEEYLRTRNLSYLELAKRLSTSIKKEFWDEEERSYNILRRSEDFKGVVNDAIIGSFYLQLYEITGDELQKERAKEVFDAIINNYLKEKISCCMIRGEIKEEIYTRDGLTIASFSYAYRLLGDERYYDSAKKIAEHYIKNHYTGEGYFKKYINSGTDAEIALGLIELYKLGEGRYKEIVLSQFEYWSRRELDGISVVDETEQFIFYVKLWELFGDERFLKKAKILWEKIESCYSEEYEAFPHGCRGNIYYSPINAIVLLGYPT